MSKIKSYVPQEKFHSTYYGCNIFRFVHNGMYNALTSKGTMRADTLAGIKELIREAEGK